MEYEKCKNCGIEIIKGCDYCLQPFKAKDTMYCYHAPLIFSKPDGDHARHFDKLSCVKEFCLDLAGYYDTEINVKKVKLNLNSLPTINGRVSLEAN